LAKTSWILKSLKILPNKIKVRFFSAGVFDHSSKGGRKQSCSFGSYLWHRSSFVTQYFLHSERQVTKLGAKTFPENILLSYPRVSNAYLILI
jgi:hypothetical protein